MSTTIKHKNFSHNLSHNEDFELLLRALGEIAFKLYTSSAETRLIVQTTERIAKSYGYKDVSVAVSPDIIVIEIVVNEKAYTEIRKTAPIGINMGTLIWLTKVCHKAEKHQITLEETIAELQNLKPRTYSHTTIVIAIALSTFAFGWLNDGGFIVACCGLLSGGFNMLVRVMLFKMKLFALFVFGVCGFVGPLTGYLIAHYLDVIVPEITLTNAQIQISMMISVLLLVPGFPFINGILDLFKGYSSMGVSRLITTFFLLLAVSVGFTIALKVIGNYFI